MQYTSSEANKLLRRLHEERDALIEREKKSSIFLAAKTRNRYGPHTIFLRYRKRSTNWIKKSVS